MEADKNLKLTLKLGSGWKYLTALQSKVLNETITALEDTETRDRKLCTSAIGKQIRMNYETLSRVLGYLVSARILRCEQYGRVVLYSFVKGWKQRLKQVTKRRQG